MPYPLDDLLLFQARILHRSRQANRAADLAQLQAFWLQASLDALQMLDIRTGEKVIVKSIPDGDGLKLADGRRVRYLGLDAPEVANYGHSAQPLAREARDSNRLLLSKGPVVILPDPDGPDKDKHSRLLRHVFVNARWLNAALLLTGLARPFLLDNMKPAIAKWLQTCADLAKGYQLGLWNAI